MNVKERQLLHKAISDLDAMKDGADEEIAHGNAEAILCNLLRDLGFGDAADAFDSANERVGFWYA